MSLQRFQSLKDQFTWRPCENVNFIADVIYPLAEARGDAIALYWARNMDSVQTYSFSDLKTGGNRAAAFLKAKGLKRGDVAILILSREIEWWDFVLGCLQIGVIVSPGTTQLSSKDILYRLQASKAKVIITTSALSSKVDDAVSEIGWDPVKISIDAHGGKSWKYYDRADQRIGLYEDCADTRHDEHALYYFTSGTTGAPKMTVHGHGYPFGHITTAEFWLDARETDIVWNISDTGWAKTAWTSLFAPWLKGSAIFAYHQSDFKPKDILTILQQYPITILCAPPTAYRMFVRLSDKKLEFKSLRRCLSAGEPLNPEVIDLWRERSGLEISEGYGQTETVILCGSFINVPIKPGSMGVSAPGINLQVINEKAEICAHNEEGDLAVEVDRQHLNGLFLEYKDDKKRTESVFKKDIWYLTGDRAYRDADGYFWFVGRSDDVILSSGYRIGPFEVESALFEHKAVLESAVVSSPDPVRGEVVKAFVVLQKGYEPSGQLILELQDYVRRTTAPYKYPRKIEFVEGLPKTVSGKIKRGDLKAQEWRTPLS